MNDSPKKLIKSILKSNADRRDVSAILNYYLRWLSVPRHMQRKDIDIHHDPPIADLVSQLVNAEAPITDDKLDEILGKCHQTEKMDPPTHNDLHAKKEKKSATEMVRNAIDAYDPDLPGKMDESELLALVSVRLKETIEDTRTTRLRLDKTLNSLMK